MKRLGKEASDKDNSLGRLQQEVCSPPLSLAHSLLHTHTLSLALSLTHTLSLAHTHTLSLAHTHTLSLIHSHSLSLSLSLSHTRSTRRLWKGGVYPTLLDGNQFSRVTA